MRVLITGGAGFIGSHIAEQALARGDEVLVLDDLSSGRRENVPPAAPLEVVDIWDRERMTGTGRTARPEAVRHQAAQASVVVSMRDPRLDAEVNLLGGLAVAEAAAQVGARLVFASTGGAIYGEVTRPEGAAEATVPCPISPYAIHKLAFEQLLAVFAREGRLSARILRYANVYGPRQDPHGEAGVVAIFSRLALRGEPLRVFGKQSEGDDGCIRDYVYVGDVARANLAALHGELDVPVLNLGSGVATSTRELAVALLRAAGSQSPLAVGPPRAGDVGRSVLDPSLSVARFGAPTPLAEGLARTVDWFRDHR